MNNVRIDISAFYHIPSANKQGKLTEYKKSITILMSRDNQTNKRIEKVRGIYVRTNAL
jgi:hypothetical protein